MVPLFYSNFYSVFLVHDTLWYAKIWFPERIKQAWPKNLHLSFSFLIFSDENNIGNIVCDVWGDLFSTNCVSYLYNWIRMNMIFKSSHSQMFCKIVVLTNFSKFTLTHLRSVTLFISFVTLITYFGRDEYHEFCFRSWKIMRNKRRRSQTFFTRKHLYKSLFFNEVTR